MGAFELPDSNTAAWLAGLLDSAMDAIITVDEAQRIVLYNRAAERIFGWPAAEMRGAALSKLLPERHRDGHGQHLRRFGATGSTSRRMSGSSVVHGLRSNGEEFPVDASISQLDTPQGKLFTVILRDVTERAESEQEQGRLAARLSGLLDSAMDGIVTIDESQKIILYNRAAERIFGWPALQVMGRSMEMLMPKRLRTGHKSHVARFGATGVTSRRMGDRTVLMGLRANGEEFPIDASISQLLTPEGKLFTVILRDVTERVRAQEELAAFAAEASGIREQEKSRIARELHDELAQSLTALKMDANWVRANLGDPNAAAAKLTDMLGLLDQAVGSTRRIAADLRPLVLDDLGLAPALEWLTGSFTQRHQIPCELAMDETLDLQEPYATALFRMVQESLVNVAKHAQARTVRVQLARTAEGVVMSVEDDGIGFRPADPRKPQSLGLVGLRERARLLRGSVAIASEPGKGTRVEARIPLGEQPDAAAI
ncbi:PAS domain S-box protein [Ramlibacter sp.]|uniref:PAS domain-containing sensor histidine kinase n=1 Tax=Ramlibacter sp. TaxID=1917967 RepID=UPI0026061E52|nr:PAS domain S-box protein [Ramlibacter sp.]MDB5953681.1 sensor signal transduction histidine kinase [Ramlibacter sp.]